MDKFASMYGPYVRFGSRNLLLKNPPWMQGTDVAVLQGVYNLMLSMMSQPIGPALFVTGVFDTETDQAVRSIETYFGLTQDGVAGPSVYFIYGQGVPPFTTYGGPVFGVRELSQGDSGGDVAILQNRLNCFRYAQIMGLPADGVFGLKTAAAVDAFKKDAIANGDTGLAPNTVVGSGTFDALWIYTFAGGRAIQPGRNGFDVVFLQTVLQSSGFYVGQVNGFYDTATQTAVKALQRTHGVTADGVVGSVTFRLLGLHNKVSAPLPFPILPI